MHDAGSDSWLQPLLLSLLAGLSTCLGAACVFCLKTKENEAGESPLSAAHMAFSLSLAGSVMVTVSFVSILPESFQDGSIDDDNSYHMIPWNSSLFFLRCVSFGIGCLLYFLLSKCAFPEPDEILGFDEEAAARIAQMEEASSDPPALQRCPSSSVVSLDEEASSVNSGRSPLIRKQSVNLRGRGTASPAGSMVGSVIEAQTSNSAAKDKVVPLNWSNLANASRGSDLKSASAKRAWRVTMLLFISLAVHNFPEGLAVAASTMHSQQLGITTTVAIALHNIPEGIAIAVPCLAARPDSPWLAFWLASVSGLAEPLGALVALFVLEKTTTIKGENDHSFMSMENVLAFVSGIMTTVALIELFPLACRHSKKSWVPFIVGLVAGGGVII
mmetsp:Transcript_6677/g.8646  ORF Transcript_6677/g.8646 Transcript_6677/m.8646 type:complete len:387 (-) Transcript_6677:15-1175(-)